MSELCARFGVSRPTGYKWVTRYRAGGRAALADRSHAPHHCPHRTGDQQEALILAVRREYGWGAKKLLAVLHRRYPALVWPARSTINDLLARHQLLPRHRRRRPWTHPGSAPLTTTRPNQVWPADFKGAVQDRGWPLLLSPDRYRSLQSPAAGLPGAALDPRGRRPARVAHACFAPSGCRTRFAPTTARPSRPPAIHGLSALSVWWMQLGIVHQRIAPASPQENGTHERMHRELKRETTRPAAPTARAQQRRFEAFRRRHNDERPHEALANATPASRWSPVVTALSRAAPVAGV